MRGKVSTRYLKLREKGWNDLGLAKSLSKIEEIISGKLGLKTAEEIVEGFISRLLEFKISAGTDCACAHNQ